MKKVISSRLHQVPTGGKAEIYEIEDFLSDLECQLLINKIEENNERSTVVDSNDEGRTLSDFRTSSSAFLPMDDIVVSAINQRMHDYLPENVELHHAEDPQGQKYDPGQYFDDHTDFFDVNDPVSYEMHTKDLGQRNWTFMIYLNDVAEGGETEFPQLGLKFLPKRGSAVIWRNIDDNGVGNPNTLHAGRPPVSGTKYIITKWFRTGVSQKKPLDQPSAKAPVRVEKFDIKPEVTPLDLLPVREDNVYTSWRDFPRFTELGFAVVDVPEDAWGIIQDSYRMLLPSKQVEKYEGMENQIYIKEDGPGAEKRDAAEIIPLYQFPSIIKVIHEKLFDLHTEWSGANLKPSYIYGIRSYLDGATLFPHRDRIATHHISSIILVDEDSREPWALDIQDHSGKWHKVYIKPGQMILYESAACSHARLDAFKGKYFRNFFCHYELVDYKYEGE